MKLDEFKAALKIDRNSLDREVRQQPTLFYEISEAYANSMGRRDGLREQLKELDAELAGQHRKAIEKGGERATEGRVEAAVLQDKRHKQLSDLYLEAKVETEKLSGMKESFYLRSSMIEEMCGLFKANYFTTDSIKGNSAVSDAVHKGQRERMSAQRRGVAE